MISASVFVFAKQLLLIFVQPYETEILAVGIQYLRIEGVFYFGIGFLFLFYGYYRAVRKPGMSVVLTGDFFWGTRGSTGICIVSSFRRLGCQESGVQFRSDGFWQILQDGFIIRNYNKDEYIMEMRVNKWRKK